MDYTMFIVLWKSHRGIWNPEQGGVFTERRLAENLIECKKAAGEPYEFVIVGGNILQREETSEEAEKRLGQFI